MNKEKVILGAVAAVATAGLGYFVFRLVKEAKRQIAEIKEEAEREKDELKDIIANKDVQLELMEENLSQLTSGTIDENWAIVEAQIAQENAELEEMRARQQRNIFTDNPEAADIHSPSEEEDYHAGAQQTAEEEVVHHNVWQ